MAWTRMDFRVGAALGAALCAGCGSDGSGQCTGDAASDAASDALEASLPPEGGQDVATTGAVLVDASILLVRREGYLCPGVSSFSINPGDLAAGQKAQLGVATIGPMPSMVQWTANPASGGRFSSSTSMSPTFQCAGPGSVTVTVQVELVVPDAGNVCDGAMYTAYSAAIQCE